MKNNKTALIIAVVSILPFAFSCQCCLERGPLHLHSIKTEVNRYPGQRLVDIYKTYFQGYLGPAHMVNSVGKEKIRKSISAEMAEAAGFPGPIYHYLPPDGRYVRVNLGLIDSGKISVEDFSDAFIKSASAVSKKDIKNFKADWQQIISVLEKYKNSIPQFDRDKAYIEALLKKDEYVVHHSKEFIKKYDPHYRVISSCLINQP